MNKENVQYPLNLSFIFSARCLIMKPDLMYFEFFALNIMERLKKNEKVVVKFMPYQ